MSFMDMTPHITTSYDDARAASSDVANARPYSACAMDVQMDKIAGEKSLRTGLVLPSSE